MEYYVIQEWTASYYCWEDGSWKYGKLNLCSKYVSFYESTNSELDSAPIVTADLRRITGFQRRQVSLVYKAIVVGVEGKKSLWFSSLTNREEVFYFLEHFWKQRLLCLGPSGEQKEQGNSHEDPSLSTRQAERKKIFEMLYDSENALIRASNTLYSQGEQLENSSRTMNRMHKDLNVTETLVNGLDRWFTRWDVKPEHYFEIRTKREYPILYRKTAKESYCPGTIVFIEGQVTVLNVKRVADVSILLKDLTSIVVNTPWNILLLRSAIGEVDVIIDVSSAQVIYILKTLQPEHGDKFHYEDDSGDAKQTIKISEMPAVEHFVTEDGGAELGDADLETVGDVVENLKSLALGINQEMTRQVDSLDQLSESVDKANYRIKNSGKKVEKKL